MNFKSYLYVWLLLTCMGICCVRVYHSLIHLLTEAIAIFAITVFILLTGLR